MRMASFPIHMKLLLVVVSWQKMKI